MKSAHLNFNVLLATRQVLKKNIVYVSLATPDRSKLFKWIPSRITRQLCYQGFKALDMAKAVWESRKTEAIFIFEHRPHFSVPLYIACLLKKVPVFFIVHDIQQTQKKSFFHYAGVELLRGLVAKFNFWPIHLELSDKAVTGIRKFSKTIVTLHPLAMGSMGRNEKAISLEKTKICIGIAGMLRTDKPILPIIKILADYVKQHDNVNLFLGTPFWQDIPIEIRERKIKLVDTSTREQYLEFLNTLDIVVADFDRELFYFRPSGIINDAISCGCFVIAPDYPVFRAQINNPVKVGETFINHTDLPRAIDHSLFFIKEHKIDFTAWQQARADDIIVNCLAEKMKQVIETGHLKHDAPEIAGKEKLL